MAQVAVIGTGYVGTVTATCFAWLGHDVVGIDVDETRAAQLAAGQAPVYEAGLPELLHDTLRTGRMTFTSDLAAITGAEVIFLCVGTPMLQRAGHVTNRRLPCRRHAEACHAANPAHRFAVLSFFVVWVIY